MTNSVSSGLNNKLGDLTISSSEGKEEKGFPRPPSPPSPMRDIARRMVDVAGSGMKVVWLDIVFKNDEKFIAFIEKLWPALKNEEIRVLKLLGKPDGDPEEICIRISSNGAQADLIFRTFLKFFPRLKEYLEWKDLSNGLK